MFSLGIRKLMVISLVGGIFLPGNIWLVVNWLEGAGVVGCARQIRKEYLTGTAITIVIALLILLMKPGREAIGKPHVGRQDMAQPPVGRSHLEGRELPSWRNCQWRQGR